MPMSWEVTTDREEKIKPEVAANTKSSSYSKRWEQCPKNEENDRVAMMPLWLKTDLGWWNWHHC